MNTSVTPLSSPAAQAPLLAQHLELMLQQVKAVFSGNFIMAGLALFALWDLAERDTLLIWAAAVFTLTFARMAMVAYYHRIKPPPQQAVRWAWGFAATSAVSGALWGAMAFLFFDTAQPLSVLFVCWAIAGMTTGAVPTLSNFLPAYVGFAVPAILPYVVRCFWEGGHVYTTFGILTLFFLAANIMYARTSNQKTAESIRLRFENLALLQQLQIEKDRAESANSAKTKFLAAASHDLRQPTHAMALFLGALERMLQRGLTASANLSPIVERMKTTLKGMGNLLTSLLDASRLEAGAVPIRRGPVRLQELFDSLQSEFSEAAQRKHLDLRFKRTSLSIDSDAVLLHRMLSNLIANAIKYTTQGRVVVGCRRRGRTVEIQVHDTGIGIAREHHQSIFQEFFQLDNTARNREQGLGLGLSIVRRTATLLDHTIGIRSEPGRGSMFSIGVPRTADVAVRMTETTVSPRMQLTGTIVVIDDDTSAREAVEDLLRAHGYDVIAGDSVAQLRTRFAGKPVDAKMIVADYRLGDGVTGVEAIRELQPMLATPVPAIIVTGDTSPDRIREAQASGYPLLHKPLDAEQLLAAIHMAVTDSSDD